MRARNLVLLVMLSGLFVLPDVAHAQFSPRGIFNQLTSPLRHMFRRHGHFPRHRAHRRAPAMAQPPAQPRAPVIAQPAINPSAAAATSPAVGVNLGWVGPAAWPSAY